MSIRGRLIVVFSLLVALPLAIVALNVAHARRLAGDAVMVDFAGSERMRAFMTAHLTDFYVRWPEPAVRRRVEEELAIWERVWKGLRDGDGAFGLKGTSDAALREELDRAGALFAYFRDSLLAAMDEAEGADEATKERRASEILSGAFGLYQFMDRVTRGLHRDSEEAVRSFQRAQGLLAVAIGIVGALALAGGFRYVLRPLPRFLDAMRAIGGGNLRARVPEEGPAEFVSIARSFNEMGGALEGARSSLLEREGELEAKNRELAHANRLKSEFLANMSHELRTPLNAVLGYAALLRRGVYGEVNAEQRQALEGIGETGNHLLALINDVLDLSKIEAGRMEVKREPVVLGSMLEELGRSVEPLVRGKGLDFRLTLVPPLPRVVTDAEKLRRVLLNFLSNAIKFTKAGSVEMRAEARDEAEVALSVRDTGVGIPSKDLSRIFEDFRQGDGSATREYGGTGLGLSICLRLARMLGARIEVETAVGAGSTFTLVLPRSPRPVAGEEVIFRGRNEKAATGPRR